MNICIFGNGNTSFEDFKKYYENTINKYINYENVHFHICEFRGIDTMTLELLKTNTENVTVYHIGDNPRYKPDSFKTKVSNWNFYGGFKTDKERDSAMINNCDSFIGIDFNSDGKRKSGTKKNIEFCESIKMINLLTL